MAKFSVLLAVAVWQAAVGAEFIPERMPAVGTNVVFSRSLIVTSNVFLGAGYVPVGIRGLVEQTHVYSQKRPGAGSIPEWIAPADASQEFGISMAFGNGTLVVKDGGTTHFFRHAEAGWVADGKITSDGENWGQRVGPVALGPAHLLSGSEVYTWPGRQFVQTLVPTNAVTGTPRAATFARGRAIISYAGGGVWSYELNPETGRFDKAEEIRPPEGAQPEQFGATLGNWAGEDLLIADLGDSTKGAGAGAVYVYRRYGENGWQTIQKIVPELTAAGDQFGTTIVSDDERIYIASPYRNEELQQAGAIFVYEIWESGAPPVWAERHRIVLHGAGDRDRLGLGMATHNRIVFATAGGRVVALHPPQELTIRRNLNNTFWLNMQDLRLPGLLESTSDLNSPFANDNTPPSNGSFELQHATNEPARYFRMRSDPAF